MPPMLASLLLTLQVPLESGIRLQSELGKQTPPKGHSVLVPPEYTGYKPSAWMTPSGVGFDEDVIKWIQFANDEGAMPRSFTNLIDRLIEEGKNAGEAEFMKYAWENGDLKGLFMSIPASVSSPHQVVLEEGDTLLFAYRVQQKDIRFGVDVVQTAFDDEFSDELRLTPFYQEDRVFSESLHASTSSSVVGFWQPPPSRFSDSPSVIQDMIGWGGSGDNQSVGGRTCTIELVWDNGYSWLTSKNVLALVGVYSRPKEEESLVQHWSGIWNSPFGAWDVWNYSLEPSYIADEGHPLDKNQCVEAKNRVAEKTGFEKDMALIGYLLEIGLKTTENLKASVEDAIDDDCDIAVDDLAIPSNVNFLTQSECQLAMSRAGDFEGSILEFELKEFLKELGRNTGEEMIKRVIEQISDECLPASEQRLSKEKCLGMRMFAMSATGPAAQVDAIKTGLKSFGMPEYQHLVAEMCKQMAEGCGGASSMDEIEAIPQPPPVQIGASAPLTLTAGECRQAQTAIIGRETGYADLHVQTWLEEQGKESTKKAANLVLEQVQLDCGASREKEPVIDNGLVETVIEADADSLLVSEPHVKESEKPGTVSSGTVRRKDFLDDKRFAKYCMMKKLKQPRASVENKMMFERKELLASGLTEEELKCFVLLLYGDEVECNVAPKSSSTKVRTQEFLLDERVKKYKNMAKFGQTRAMIENKLAADRANLLKQGLTEEDIHCIKELIFEGVDSCDASPAGKVLGLEFLETDNEFFKKYKRMHKFGQTKDMLLNKIKGDMDELTKLGFGEIEMNCFVRLLFGETTKCICGPAKRSEATSKEAKNLALAKETQEKLKSLLDGDSGLLPAVLPSLSWAIDVFEVDVPEPKAKTEKPKTTVSKKLETFLDGKVQQDVNIILGTFPLDPEGNRAVWEVILAQLAEGEFTFARQLGADPLRGDLETIQRALNRISDGDLKALSPHIEKITDKHDVSHRFAKVLVGFHGREGASLKTIIDCMLAEEGHRDSMSHKLETLARLQNDYKHYNKLASTLATASGGFLVQLHDARVAMTDSSTAQAKQSINLYDSILKIFRQKAGFHDGDETVAAIVPMLALFNVIIDPSKRLRPDLFKTIPELAPTYLELFKTFMHRVSAEEFRQDVAGDAEEILSHARCVEVMKAMAAASKAMFKEMALDKHLKRWGKMHLKAEVKKLLEKQCVKPREPVHKISNLLAQCMVVLDKPEPRTDSVRRVVAGVAKTQKAAKKCLKDMPVLKQGPYEAVMDEANLALKTAEQIQDTVFEVMIQSSGPFLPHDGRGNVDRKALLELVNSLPDVEKEDNTKRIYGESLPPTYKVADLLDDEALRYATRKICSELLSEAEI